MDNFFTARLALILIEVSYLSFRRWVSAVSRRISRDSRTNLENTSSFCDQKYLLFGNVIHGRTLESQEFNMKKFLLLCKDCNKVASRIIKSDYAYRKASKLK